MVASKRDVRGQIAALLGDVRREIDVSRNSRIYCNRNLKMEDIELVGFDMDYTLALYNQERLEQLSIELTIGKLIADKKYPEEIRDLQYDRSWAIRGLVIDKTLGNILKMDRHTHAGRVYHGRRLLTRDERKKDYRSTRVRLSSSRYAWIDTLFALPEAVMYVNLVDYFDAKKRSKAPSYKQLFSDIRECIDQCHADDSLKKVIRADLPGFIIKDRRLAETLHKLRSSGKKLFLLTNSYAKYSDAVMSYLLDGEREAYPSWKHYFDYTIVGGKKPAFFSEKNPFLEVDPSTFEARNDSVTKLRREQIYQGGNIFDFEKMTGVQGDKVLYVGDHIYGDILRLRKSHTWRTAMVLQELNEEYQASEGQSVQTSDLEILDRRRRNLDSEIDYQVVMLKQISRIIAEANPEDSEMRSQLLEAKSQAKKTLDSLRARSNMYESEVSVLEESIEASFNPHWGSMFRENNENSRFGQQVNDYADLYTTRASNFLSYSPLRYFRAPRRRMPHEV